MFQRQNLIILCSETTPVQYKEATQSIEAINGTKQEII